MVIASGPFNAIPQAVNNEIQAVMLRCMKDDWLAMNKDKIFLLYKSLYSVSNAISGCKLC